MLMQMPKMDSIKNAATAANISESFLRELVKSGKVFAIKTGTKNLVNLNSLAAYLNGGGTETKDTNNS